MDVTVREEGATRTPANGSSNDFHDDEISELRQDIRDLRNNTNKAGSQSILC